MATPQFYEQKLKSTSTNPTLLNVSSTIDGVENCTTPPNHQSHCEIINLNCKINEVGVGSPKLKVLHEDAHAIEQDSKTTTFFQTMVNCVSMLFGLGMLSSPFAVAQGGSAAASAAAFLISAAYMYAAYLMSRCVDASGHHTYEGVATASFSGGGGGGRHRSAGAAARRIVAAVFYLEILGTLVGYCISIGDNLARLFPSPPPPPFFTAVNSHNFLLSAAALLILPTVWLRDLSALSFTSLWCIASTLALLAATAISAAAASTHLRPPLPLIRPSRLPIAAGLYAFSFGGTSVFPSIYASMCRRSHFPAVLLLSFLISTAATAGLGLVGAAMFGADTASQVTLSMPRSAATTKVVLWMTVLTPVFKFALQLSPVTAAIEGRIRKRFAGGGAAVFAACTCMRSAVLAAIVVFSMIFPYFETVAALIGSSMTILICLIFPSFFYLRLHWDRLRLPEIGTVSAVATCGAIVGVYGTIVAMQGILHKRRSSDA